MGVTNIVRNLRDGQLVITDGGSETLTLALDNGDLSWSEPENDVQILDRGSLDHARDGDEAPVELSFSAMWTNLINASEGGGSAGSANQLYEMINNSGDTYTSVASTGHKYQLKHAFTVIDPAGNNTELIEFNNVYKQSLECAEGDDANTITFSGIDFEVEPTITQP